MNNYNLLLANHLMCCENVSTETTILLFLLLCTHSKGSVIVTYQLVLRKEYKLSDIKNTMTNFAKEKSEPFEIKRDSVIFSGKFAILVSFEQKRSQGYNETV